MTALEELKQKRREIDAKIKELEGERYIRCGNARYEHRVYSTGKVEEIIAINKHRETRGKDFGIITGDYWVCAINKQTKAELMTTLRSTITDLQQLLERMEGSE